MYLRASTTPMPNERAIPSEAEPLLQDLLLRYGPRLRVVLADRSAVRERLMAGHIAFNESTAHVREADWVMDPVPVELLERRVELLGDATRMGLVQGMNAGARSYIADLWNMSTDDPLAILRAHNNLERAVGNRLAYVGMDGDRHRIDPGSTTRLMLAPRPLNVMHDAGTPAAILDLAIHMVQCAKSLRLRQGGAYLYLRGVHGHLEARLWREMIEHAEEVCELPRGTVRATVVVDNLLAALEADEILFEFMHHGAGLSLDPQGFAAEHISLFHGADHGVLPDRESIGLNTEMLRSLALMTIATCHRRQTHAMGAPSYVLPPKDGAGYSAVYMEMIADKEREALDGHDGTIVAHPGTITAAMAEFNKSMPRAHQMYLGRKEQPEPNALIAAPVGALSTEGLLAAVRTILRAMLMREQGMGVVVQGGRLHDRSSVRLSTILLWSWVQSPQGVISDTGLEIHEDLVRYLVRKEAEKISAADPERKEAAMAAAAKLTRALIAPEVPGDMLAGGVGAAAEA